MSWPVRHHLACLLAVWHLWGLGKGVLTARSVGSAMEVGHIAVYIFLPDFLWVAVQYAAEICLVTAGAPSCGLCLGGG